jgi:hypothetical protein
MRNAEEKEDENYENNQKFSRSESEGKLNIVLNKIVIIFCDCLDKKRIKVFCSREF